MNATPEYMDTYTEDLFNELFSGTADTPPEDMAAGVAAACGQAQAAGMTEPIVNLFMLLLTCRRDNGLSPAAFGINREQLETLAREHATADEHHGIID